MAPLSVEGSVSRSAFVGVEASMPSRPPLRPPRAGAPLARAGSRSKLRRARANSDCLAEESSQQRLRESLAETSYELSMCNIRERQRLSLGSAIGEEVRPPSHFAGASTLRGRMPQGVSPYSAGSHASHRANHGSSPTNRPANTSSGSHRATGVRHVTASTNSAAAHHGREVQIVSAEQIGQTRLCI